MIEKTFQIENLHIESKTRPLRVGLFGRTNVGKSTLFNRLVGRVKSLAYDSHGVTRDWKVQAVSLGESTYDLVDTPGLEQTSSSFYKEIQEKNKELIQRMDYVFFVVDGQSPDHPEDRRIGRWLLKHGGKHPGKDLFLLANRCESPRQGEVAKNSFYDLAMGEPLVVSALHGRGMEDLERKIQSFVSAHDSLPRGAAPHLQKEENLGQDILRCMLIGRPNVGKSTFINQLIGENRLFVGPEAGTTRDSISLQWTYKGRSFELVDSPGFRKKSAIEDKLEEYMTAETLRMLKFCHTAILLIDVDQPLCAQDMFLGEKIIQEGRNLIIGCNKWDKISKPGQWIVQLRQALVSRFPSVKDVPLLPVSALRGEGVASIMDQVIASHHIWSTTLGTGVLNRWLKVALEEKNPPLHKGRMVRLKYVKQVSARPPSFVFFGNQLERLPQSYTQYLRNHLRQFFGLYGVPLRLTWAQRANPYTSS